MSLIISLMLELENSYQKKERNIFSKLFKKWDPEHLQFDEDFDDYLDDDGHKDIIRDESIQNVNNDD